MQRFKTTCIISALIPILIEALAEIRDKVTMGMLPPGVAKVLYINFMIARLAGAVVGSCDNCFPEMYAILTFVEVVAWEKAATAWYVNDSLDANLINTFSDFVIDVVHGLSINVLVDVGAHMYASAMSDLESISMLASLEEIFSFRCC